jgi:hypothetical protein
MRIFKSRHQLFDRVKPYADIRQFRFEDFTTCNGTHLSIVTVTVNLVLTRWNPSGVI